MLVFFWAFDGNSIDRLFSVCMLEVFIIAGRLGNDFPSFRQIFLGGQPDNFSKSLHARGFPFFTKRSRDKIDKFMHRGQLCIDQIPRHLTSSPSRGGFDNQGLPRNLIPMHRDGEFEPKPRLHVTFKSCASWQTSLERFQREGYSRKFLVGLCPLVFYFRPKNVIFPCPNPFLGVISKIHTRFQTQPLGKNYS